MSLTDNPHLWRHKVVMHAQDWVQVPGKYQDCQKLGHALYQSIIKSGKASGDKHLPTLLKRLMAGQGENWPWMVDCAVKRLATRWRPLNVQAKMPDGQPIAEALLSELEWIRGKFAIPLVVDAGGNEQEGYRLVGDIMIDYLRKLGDIVETYLRDEQEFVWIE